YPQEISAHASELRNRSLDVAAESDRSTDRNHDRVALDRWIPAAARLHQCRESLAGSIRHSGKRVCHPGGLRSPTRAPVPADADRKRLVRITRLRRRTVADFV